MSWPPELDDLKSDMKITDDRDDARLQQVLDAAVAFVERVHGVEALGGAAADDLVLGTLRLAGRWHIRRRSPDALIAAGDLGTSRVPSFDPDIDRLLRIGKFRRSVIA